MIWENFLLFFKHIAPSHAAHGHTCCEDFCGRRAGVMASEILEINAFGPQLNAFMSVGTLLQYFPRKLLQFDNPFFSTCYSALFTSLPGC